MCANVQKLPGNTAEITFANNRVITRPVHDMNPEKNE